MTKEEIGITLKQLRLACGMTQKEVAEKIGRKQQIVGHWETGYAQPDANTLFTLCEIYGTTVDEAFGFIRKNVVVTPSDYNLIKKYQALDSLGKEHVDNILEWESQRVELLLEKDALIADMKKQFNSQIVQLEATKSNSHLYTYLNKIACAGTGFYFDDIPTDVIEAPHVHGADFIIGVSGDSMEPIFHDGDKLYIQKTDSLSLGDMGIFTVWGECFVKELGERGLISRNPAYDDISGTEDVRLIGRVLGIVEEK